MTLQHFIEQVGAIDDTRFDLVTNDCDDSINSAMTLMRVANHLWIKREDAAYVQRVTTIIEEAIRGCSSDAEAVCTCLLESIQNKSIRENTDAITKWLLPQSRRFCQAVDELYGNPTPGV